MTTITLLTVGAVGFALGMYVSSQLERHINKSIKRGKKINNNNNK